MLLDFGYNYYFGLGNGSDEKVLDGYDLQLASKHLITIGLDVFVNAYEWDGEDRDDINLKKYGKAFVKS